MSEAVLQASSVGKTYFLGQRPLTVLKNIDFALHAGEFIALQGASGSGKSTLLQLLGGLDVPTEGQILFKNEQLHLNTASLSARFRGRHVGFVFQAYHLLPDLDAVENVMLPAQVLQKSHHASLKRARELLSQVGLAKRMYHRPNQLSGGEQQRVAIARALMNEPEIVLADEAEIIELLRGLHEQRQLTLLVATHDETVAAAAQRVVRLKDGEIDGED